MRGLVGIVFGIVKNQPDGLKHADVVREVRRRGVSYKGVSLSEAVHRILSNLVSSGAIIRNEVSLERRYHPNDSKRLRILVVDDDTDNADSSASLLEFAGHEVRTAYSGSDALRTVEEWQPNVVLLDIEMPMMNGYDTARNLRKTQKCPIADNSIDCPGCPICNCKQALTLVAVTGRPDRMASKEAGFDYHLTKPVEEQKLLEVVEFGTYPREVSHRDRFQTLTEEFA